MRIRKTKAITIQTSQVLIIKQRGQSIRKWCGYCNKEVSMLTLDEEAITTSSKSRELHCLFEIGQIHFETVDGLVFVCTNSLLKSN